MVREPSVGPSGGLQLTRRSACKSLGAALVAGVGAGAATAQGSFPPDERTDWGRPTSLGDGVVAAFVTADGAGNPEYVGVWFTADALTGLPSGPEEHYETPVDLPPAATETGTAFEWAEVDWNPAGHPPPRVYDVPHFDFHFYRQSREQVVEELPDGECDVDGDGTPDFGVPCEVYDRAVEPIPDAQVPPRYVSSGEVVPHMGNHLVDEDAREFGGEPFTHTMIWGSFGGELTFVEPMVAMDFLESLQDSATAAVPLPNTAPEAGYYPSLYAIRYLSDQNAYAVTLEQFEQLPGPSS